MKNAPPEFNRTDLLNLIANNDSVLEIGPFTRPAYRGDNVEYFDVLSREELIERATKIGYPTQNVPEIHHVSPIGDLSIVNKKFDVCLSSHCIEHQPDLILHLNNVSTLLNAGGRYLVIVPDKRYCFDHFIPASTVADVVAAIGARVHSLKSVIEHRALVTHNDASRHWRGDHGSARADANPQHIVDAVNEYSNAGGNYIDVHAWQFTPLTFRRLIEMLFAIHRIKMKIANVYPTPYNGIEFCAVLELA